MEGWRGRGMNVDWNFHQQRCALVSLLVSMDWKTAFLTSPKSSNGPILGHLPSHQAACCPKGKLE